MIRSERTAFSHMENKAIASIFREIADILEIKDENVFRIRAYRQAADRIEGIDRQLYEIFAEDPGAIRNIPGVGRDLAGKIEEMVTTGHLEFYSRLVKEFPPGFLELLNIPTLGPKKLRDLRNILSVKNIHDLEKVCRNGKVAELDGMGEKTQKKLLEGISLVARSEGYMLADEGAELADKIIEFLMEDGNFKKIEKAGSLRRGVELVGDIDILAQVKDQEKAANKFVSFPMTQRIIAKGSTKCSIEVGPSRQIDLRMVDEECFGAALVYFTGSKQHNIKIRNIAKKNALKLNEYGVFAINVDGKERLVGGKTEKEVYKKLRMQWIPPELREDRGEVEAALKGEIPRDLVQFEDIKGDLHLHTVDTDGKMGLDELIEAAMEKGYHYMAVTNHSKLVRIANGMDEKRLLEHVGHVRKTAKRYGKIKVLAGVEVDILRDGTLDIEDYALRELDIVIAAVHSNFSADREIQSERLLRAMDNKYVNILAHPSGRLIRKRAALDFDRDRIFTRAAENNVMLEINTHGERVDLNDTACLRAKALGAKFVISTDAHEKRHMTGMKLGVATARRAWLTKKDIVNTYTFDKLVKSLKR